MSTSSATSAQIRCQFDAQAWPNATGEFEIIAINAGKANGWNFPAATLEKSVPLWDNVSCFVDHSWFGQSLKDLGGVGHSPTWAEEDKGVHLTLRTIGPSGPLVTALAKEMLSEGPKPRVGFSADVVFTAEGREVKDILRVYSLDLVFDPARGGAFVRALNSMGEGYHPRQQEALMAEHQAPATQAPAAAGNTQAQLSQNAEALRQILGVQREQAALVEQAEAARAVRTQMCQYLLEAGLAASKLPAPAQDYLRVQFTGRSFEAVELTNAIDAARALVSQLTGPSTVKGPKGLVAGMFNSDDQLQAAVDDLFGAERDADKKALKVQRLHGIRELYLMLTGDDDLHGGFYPNRVRLATTADFTGLVKNALNKIVVNQWEALGRAGYDWWMRVTTQEHFDSIQGITGTLVGTVGALPVVAEGAEYTELVVGDSPETASFVKYGGYIPLTLELIDRDETRKLRQYPRELANAGIRRLSGLVAAVFTDASGIGPTMADGGALFNSTAVTTAGGHVNLLTTALAAAEWEVVATAVYNQPLLIKNAASYYGTGPKMGISPRFCLVPRTLQLTAMKIIYPTLENASNIYSENQQRGQPGDVVTVPEWTDADDWAAVCDPAVAPAIFVGERFGLLPEVFIAGDSLSPAVFMNDEHRLKVRHFLAVWVNDFRPLHKSNV